MEGGHTSPSLQRRPMLSVFEFVYPRVRPGFVCRGCLSKEIAPGRALGNKKDKKSMMS